MRKLITSFFLLVAFVAGQAFAASMMEPMAYDMKSFEMLQKEGKPTLVSIHADWCPTCKAQAPIIDELLSMPEFKDFKLVRVNFDTQKNAVKMFKATMQSTLIVYKNGKEVGRSTGETKKDSIAALLKKSMM